MTNKVASMIYLIRKNLKDRRNVGTNYRIAAAALALVCKPLSALAIEMP